MSRTATKKLAAQLIGTKFTTPKDGTGTVTDVWTAGGVTWIGVTVQGGGFNGGVLKTAVRHSA